MCIWLCMYIHICMYIHMFVCMCVYVRTYLCTYVCVCMYVRYSSTQTWHLFLINCECLEILFESLINDRVLFVSTCNLVFNCHFVWDGNQVHGLKATWSGKLSDSHTTAVYVYYKTERRNCRYWWSIKPGHDTAVFQNIATHRFEFPEAWVCTSRQDHHLLAKCGGNSEKGKMLFLARSMCNHVIVSVWSHNRYSLVHTPRFIAVIIH